MEDKKFPEISPLLTAKESELPTELQLSNTAHSLPKYLLNPKKANSDGLEYSNSQDSLYTSDLDFRRKTSKKWKFDTCSLSSRNSEDEEEDLDTSKVSYFSSTSLPLTPFKNQVGGHASFLRFSEKALCKPLDSREQSFYEKISSEYPQILPFVATYLGIVNVSFKSRNDHDIFSNNTPVVMLEHNKHLLGDDPEENTGVPATAKYFNKKLQQQIFREALSPKGLRARFAQLKSVTEVMKNHCTISHTINEESEMNPLKEKSEIFSDENDQIFQMSDDEFLNSTPIKARKSATTKVIETKAVKSEVSAEYLASKLQQSLTISSDRISTASSPLNNSILSNQISPESERSSQHMNPWSAHLYNTKMANRSNADPSMQKFLLLEDLTQGLEYPCILDLKMGSRQHGVFATAEKKLSQERKCERSTSKRLGVRICGMQLFRQDTGQFKYLDKYVGRSINIASFKQTLISFIDNGEKYLIGHIPGILKKLKELYESVLTMNTCRFYASSLLILYDGQNIPTKAADIKMIDFANCITSLDLVCNYPPSTNGPDGGYLLGLRTLISKFEEIYQEFAGDGKNLDSLGHILISQVSKIKRATAEIGPI